MSTWRDVEGAIYSRCATTFGKTYPTVTPNESYDPENRASTRFASFTSGWPYLIAQVEMVEASKETHGTNGLRQRAGELRLFAFNRMNDDGPGALLEIAATAAAQFDETHLSSETIQFDTPLVYYAGPNEDETEMAVARCPFVALVTS